MPIIRFVCHVASVTTMSVSLLLMLAHTASADNPADSVATRELILHIGHFNFDSHLDTIIGGGGLEQGYYPKFIRWGESAGNDIDTTGAKRMKSGKQTALTYPGWDNFRASVACEQFNGDTLADIILYMFGRIRIEHQWRDTMRVLAIFGQSGLDTNRVLKISDVGEIQNSPFIALDLKIDVDLTDRKKRDISGVASFVLERSSKAIEEERQRDGPLQPMAPSASVRLFPNPSATTTNIEARRVPAGEYDVDVIGTNGQVHTHQQCMVDESGQLLRSLDLNDLPSGYYFVRLRSGNRIVGDYPIVVAH